MILASKFEELTLKATFNKIAKSEHEFNLLAKATGDGNRKEISLAIASLSDITLIEYHPELDDVIEGLHNGSFHEEAHKLEIQLNSII